MIHGLLFVMTIVGLDITIVDMILMVVQNIGRCNKQ
jgi:hypothetical protein